MRYLAIVKSGTIGWERDFGSIGSCIRREDDDEPKRLMATRGIAFRDSVRKFRQSRDIGRDGFARVGYSRRQTDAVTGKSRRLKTQVHSRRDDREFWEWQRRRRSLERGGEFGSCQPNWQNEPRRAGLSRPAQNPAAKTRRSCSLQKNPIQQSRQTDKEDISGIQDRHTSANSPLSSIQPQPVEAETSSKQLGNAGVKSYAQVVQQSQEGGGKSKDTVGIQSSKHPKRDARPVDPVQEGRCFRCLGHGHAARDCRDPIVCRLCRSPGHRQASCPLQREQRRSPPSSGLFDCLVGEVGSGEVTWDHVIEGIRTVCPDITSPDAHLLSSGEIFLLRLSKTDWRSLLGITQQLPGGISVSWRRPKPSDGAIDRHSVIKRLEVRGVPFGLRTWNHLGRIIRPAGTLRKIVSNGVQFGDPNHVCIDVEMNVEKEIPKVIWTAGEGGRDTKIMIAALPPPPPPCYNGDFTYPALPRQRKRYCHHLSTSRRRADQSIPGIRAA